MALMNFAYQACMVKMCVVSMQHFISYRVIPILNLTVISSLASVLSPRIYLKRVKHLQASFDAKFR